MRWAAVALAAILVATAACASGSLPQAPASPMNVGRPAPGPTPPGTRPVTFHGLTIFVPTSWATDAVECGAPLKDTVFFGDGAQPACGSSGSNRFTVARFGTWTPGHPDTRLTQRPLVIDGHHATLGTGVEDGTRITQLIVRDIAAQLDIDSSSATIGTRLLRSAQITQSDANGCPSTMPYIDLTSPPTHGPADVMVAGSPAQVVICHYLRTYLEQGISLSTADGARLVTALNALPSGLSEVRRNTYLSGLCRGGKLAAQGDSSDEEDFALRFGYPGRAASVVYGRLGLCGAIGFTNGTRTGQRETQVVTVLNAALDNALTWPGDIHPR